MSGPNQVAIGQRLDEFPGRSFNLLVQEWYRQRSKLPPGKTVSGPSQFIIVRARNITGEALNYGNCASIEGLAVPYDNQENQNYRRPLLNAQKHTSALNHAIMGVALTPIADDHTGPFIIAGGAWVRCNFSSDSHHFVTLETEQEDLVAVSSTSGYPILDSEPVPDPGYLPMELWAFVLLGGGSSVSAGVEIDMVLIDEDIDPGIFEDDPSNILEAADIPLTEDEIEDGWDVVFQEPPDDDLTANLVDNFNLWSYPRKLLTLKVYDRNGTPNSGTAQGDGGAANKIQLSDTASTVDDIYIGDIITTTGGSGSGQSATVTDYAAGSFTATVDITWSPSIDATTEYTITSTRNLKLATEMVDDTENKKRVVRYSTISVFYDDGDTIKLGEYEKVNYPDYPEDESFPPDGEGTYREEAEGFFTKRIRGIVIGGVLVTALCKELPPPPLTVVES